VPAIRHMKRAITRRGILVFVILFAVACACLLLLRHVGYRAPQYASPDLQRLAQQLASQDAETRYQAACALVYSPDEHALQVLMDGLNHRRSEVRKTAVEALRYTHRWAQDPDPYIVESLMGLMVREKNSVIGWKASEALSRIGEPAVEPLLSALRHRKATVRKRAASALTRMAAFHHTDERIVEPLVRALRDRDAEVRREAASGLGYIRDKRAVESLTMALQDDAAQVRSEAAMTLGKIGDPRAVGPLIECLKDEEASVRQWAASSLRLLDDKRAVEPLIALLKDSDLNVRQTAVSALKKLGDTRAVEPLIALVEDEHIQWRGHAMRALGRLGDPRALGPLIAKLNDEDPGLRRAAAAALGALGDPGAVQALIAALDDPGEGVCMSAARSLEMIDSPPARQRLLEALENKEVEIIAAAHVFFVQQGIEGSEPILIEALRGDYYDSDCYYQMADVFSTCGNKRLERVGKEVLWRPGLWSPGKCTVKWGEGRQDGQ